MFNPQTPDIRPFAEAVDRAIPVLRDMNTYKSIGELVWRAMVAAGPDWQPIAKTHGEGGKWIPDGFVPYAVNVTRPDGQQESITVVGWSHDAVWHVPTRQQVKVVTNSAANDDPNPAIHGPGQLNSYQIDPKDFRYYNPPAPMLPLPSPTPGVPVGSQPNQPPPARVLDKGQAFTLLKELNHFYGSPDGLNRPGGLVLGDGTADMEAIAQWFYQMVIEGKTLAEVIAQIKGSQEYRDKHPVQAAPQD